MQFTIPVDTIKALLCAAAKKDIRYYLNGICLDVRAADAVAVATNGHMLIAVPVERTENDAAPTIAGQYIISRDLLDGLKAPRKNGPALVTVSGDIVTIMTGAAQVSGKLIDGKFPDWRRVVPRVVSNKVSQFDLDYVTAFQKAHGLLGGKLSPAIFHNGSGDGLVESAARVRLAGGAVGVLMPMRGGDGHLNNPDWLAATPAPETAAAA